MLSAVDDSNAAGYAWEADADTHSRPYTREPVVPDEFNAGASGLKALYGGIRSLCAQDPEEDGPPPTKDALCHVYEVLERTAYVLMQDPSGSGFPPGYAVTDEQGGIRIEWWQERTHCVILVIGHSSNAPSYIFTKSGVGHDGRMDQLVLPGRLAERLRDLNVIRNPQG
jgi:hypothetical protein